MIIGENMENEEKKRKSILVSFLIVIVCFLYLGARGTFTAFESIISGRASANTAAIHLKINGEEVTSGDDVLDNSVILENTTWTSAHTRAEKIAPGSSGTISLELDPDGSEVAILYEFQFVDKMIDNDKLLTFDTITCDHTFVRTGVDTYSGIIPLADVLNGDTISIDVDFHFDALTDIEGVTEDNQEFDEFFEIHFHDLQYQGEQLVPYVEPTPEPDPGP